MTAPVSIAAASKTKSLLGLGKKAEPKEDPEALRLEMLRVAREEVEAKTPGFPAAWEELVACGMGTPQLTGAFAKAVTELGHSVPAEGSGQLAGFKFSDPMDVFGVLQEVKEFLTKPAEVPVALLPPDAPESDPALASKAPEPDPEEGAEDTTPAAPATTETTAAPVKRGRGRPKKNAAPVPSVVADPQETAVSETVAEVTEVEPQVTTIEASPDVPVTNVEQQASPVTADGICVYVNCTPSVATRSLWPLILEITEELHKAAGDAKDYRRVSNNHDLAYGRWKAAVALIVRAQEIPSGHYVIDNAVGEVAQVVIETLRALVAERGGIFVQGAA